MITNGRSTKKALLWWALSLRFLFIISSKSNGCLKQALYCIFGIKMYVAMSAMAPRWCRRGEAGRTAARLVFHVR
jgi:hypothetical protein